MKEKEINEKQTQRIVRLFKQMKHQGELRNVAKRYVVVLKAENVVVVEKICCIDHYINFLILICDFHNVCKDYYVASLSPCLCSYIFYQLLIWWCMNVYSSCIAYAFNIRILDLFI